MSNFFNDVVNDFDKLEQELLGPDYKYYKYVVPPEQMGMSSEGSIGALVKDVEGIINYVELLVTGRGKASATGNPLGDKFFLKTGGQCKDVKTGKLVDRYMYINNVPDGSIPFLSSVLNMNFSDFEGLIPGVLGDLEVMNPLKLFSAFMEGAEPPCQEVTMETIDSNNNSSSESQHVPVTELKSMSPCWFENGKNVVTGESCREEFKTLNNTKFKSQFSKYYYFVVSLIGLFILYKLTKKHM